MSPLSFLILEYFVFLLIDLIRDLSCFPWRTSIWIHWFFSRIFFFIFFLWFFTSPLLLLSDSCLFSYEKDEVIGERSFLFSKIGSWYHQFCSVTQYSVQSLSHVWLFATPWTAAHQASLSITDSQNLLRPISIESVMPSNHSLLTPSPTTFNLFQHQGLFKWVSCSHQVAKVLKFQLQHQSFQWIFRTDFL